MPKKKKMTPINSHMLKGVKMKPTAANVFFLRERVGQTQQQAADLLYVTRRTWIRWEDPEGYDMPPAYWELYRLKCTRITTLRHQAKTREKRKAGKGGGKMAA